MRELYLLSAVASVFAFAYVDTSKVKVDIKPVAGLPTYADTPEMFRQQNYKGGSCVHASTITALRYHGRHDIAQRWRERYAYGEYVACAECNNTLLQKMDNEGVPYRFTSNGDPTFLEWASKTRRPCVITYKPNHAINFFGFVNGQAKLLDNNRPGQYEYVAKEQFLRSWKGYGGDAVALMYPVPPANSWR